MRKRQQVNAADVLDMASGPTGVTLDELYNIFGSEAFDLVDVLAEEGIVWLDDQQGVVYASGSNPSRGLAPAVKNYMGETKQQTNGGYKMKFSRRPTTRYNSMSPAGKALAQRAKRLFAKDYPSVKVGISAREGWITVDGKKAVNMSRASSRPMTLEDVVDKMKQKYLGHPTLEENTVKITKSQLKTIIKEEKQKLVKEMRRSSGDAVAAVEKGLAAIMLQKVLDDPDGPMGRYEASEIFQYMNDIGFEDFETQAALDQLAKRYNLR